MLEELFKVTKDGVILKVEVVPSSKGSEIVGVNVWRKTLKVNLKSPAREGRANKELLILLKEAFGYDAELVSGAKKRRKEIMLKGADRETILEKLKKFSKI